MGDVFVDRRNNNNRNTASNRRKLLLRISDAVLEKIKSELYSFLSVSKQVANVTLTDAELLTEYEFHYNPEDGIYSYVNIDNIVYRYGDRIPKRMEPSAAYGYDPKDGDGNFELTAEELRKMILNDVKLPKLVPKTPKISSVTRHIGGYTKQGSPAKLDRKKSVKKAIVRYNALDGAVQRKIAELEKKIEDIHIEIDFLPHLHPSRISGAEHIVALEQQIDKLKHTNIVKYDKGDLRYRSHYYTTNKTTNAVVFFMMDVSGSMDSNKKYLAKLGCWVLYSLLKEQYRDHIEPVFIIHMDDAWEVNESRFFNSSGNGGTKVSSSLELTYQLIQHKYSPDNYNIYMLQLTDGENMDEDNAVVMEYINKLIHVIQLYSFVAIQPSSYAGQLQPLLERLKQENNYKDMAVSQINAIHDWVKYFQEVFSE